MLQVLLANDKKEGNVRDPKENEKMMRLFIIVPKKYSESDVKKEFEVSLFRNFKLLVFRIKSANFFMIENISCI